MEASNNKTAPRGRRKPRKATPAYLERAALFYLDRYATSAENLRRVLRRKVQRSARFHEVDQAACEAAIEELTARFLRSGLLDDAGYAETRSRSLFRRGQSLRAIRQNLAQKGVGKEEAEAAIERLREENAAPDLTAALAYARRRRLGPYRAEPERANRRERDLAALARRGFAPDIALAVIDAASAAELEEVIASHKEF